MGCLRAEETTAKEKGQLHPGSLSLAQAECGRGVESLGSLLERQAKASCLELGSLGSLHKEVHVKHLKLIIRRKCLDGKRGCLGNPCLVQKFTIMDVVLS